MKQATNRTLVSVINKKYELNFLPYIHIPASVTPLVLYEKRSQHILLSQQDSLASLAVAMVVSCPGTATFQAGDWRGRDFVYPPESLKTNGL